MSNNEIINLDASFEVFAPEADDGFARQLEEAYSLTPEEFAALKVAHRDVVLFMLLRETASTLRSMELRLNEYEEKAQALASPEGIQDLMSKFMGGMGGGQAGPGMGRLLAGMIR